MKLNGRKPQPNTDVVVIPRGDGDFVFYLKAVPDYKEFEELYALPVPPMVQRTGEAVASPNFNDMNYVSSMSKRNEARMNWLVLKTISGTPELEFETVNIAKPHTWGLFEKEMIDSGFTQNEVNYLLSKCFEVNSLSEGMLDAARARFLASQQALPATS